MPMEVKQILSKIRQQKEEKKEYFFALQIDVDLVKTALWTIATGQVRVLAIGQSQRWQDQKTFIEAVDESLSSATEKLLVEKGAPEPNKVIFGLPAEWVEGEKIIESKLGLLKVLSQKLELSPVGFVVTAEAVIHHLKNIEGIPPTAILVGLGESKLLGTLARLGKIVGSERIERSGDLGADLAEGLSRFEQETEFPARVLLYNAEENLEKERQELIDYDWQGSKVRFLHLPKVEILSSDFDIKAVALAGGREVAREAGMALLEPAPKEKESPEVTPKEIKEKSFGFVRGGDVALKEPQEKPKESEELVRPEEPKEQLLAEEAPSWLPRLNLPRIKLPQLPWPGFKMATLKSIFSGFHLGNRASLIAGLVLGLTLIIGGALGALYWYLPQAEIVLLVKPYKLEKDFTLRLDPSLERPNREDLALPADEVKATLEGKLTGETTGTKLVGDPAQGEVTIYNRTSTEKTFSAGTEIIGPNELKFSLDEIATVASESAGPDYTRIPGKATAKVTALEIGTEGNLATGTEFSVADFATSDFIGKNESVFSGGTSREILVVSERDQEKLLAELKKELETGAVEKLLADAPAGKQLLDESLATEILQSSFNKEIGEEVAEIELTLQVEAVALSYSEESLRELIEEEIKKSIPAEFEYQREKVEATFELEKMNEDGSATFIAHFQANLAPRFDLETIKKSLTGKYPPIGKAYLENLPHVEAVEIKITPRLPSRLTTFPRSAKRIEIEIKPSGLLNQ